MKYTIKIFVIATCCATFLLCSWSCSFEAGKSSALELLPGWPQQQIKLTLPSYPTETHPPIVGWKLVHLQGGQTITQYLAATEKSVLLNMDKNQPTPVLCYPLTEAQGKTLSFFRPAGCVYPYSQEATWLDGFTAEIFLRLAKSKSLRELAISPLLRLNWPRLSQQISKRIESNKEKGKIFSPWFLQDDILKNAILNGTASTRSIKQENLIKLPLIEIQNLSQKKVLNPLLEGNSSHASSNEIYYRYIPAGKISQNQTEAHLIFPQNLGYEIHQENIFLMGEKILSVFTKKNQKPVLATISIERYTEGNETF